ncbi:MAG: MCE family protein [Gammaproteobacteria bacterium]|nr:MCE family protein [Gammaproteobacteria bacterium]
MGRDTHALATGLFLLTLIIGLVGIVYWIGSFEKARDLYVISTRDSVTGLNPESTVYYRGIAVGKVLTVNFDPSDPLTILVEIEVDSNIRFTRGIFATLRLKGVTGLTQIDLQDSGDSDEWLLPGDRPEQRIPLRPSLTDRLLSSGEEILMKAEQLMIRLDRVLSDENEEHGSEILRNLNVVTEKMPKLEDQLGKVLERMPNLINSTETTLGQIGDLTIDLKAAANSVKVLGDRGDALIASGANVGDVLTGTTLPKVHQTMNELQSTMNQLKRVANMLEANPQALILGPVKTEPAPGEPGYEEPQ